LRGAQRVLALGRGHGQLASVDALGKSPSRRIATEKHTRPTTYRRVILGAAPLPFTHATSVRKLPQSPKIA